MEKGSFKITIDLITKVPLQKVKCKDTLKFIIIIIYTKDNLKQENQQVQVNHNGINKSNFKKNNKSQIKRIKAIKRLIQKNSLKFNILGNMYRVVKMDLVNIVKKMELLLKEIGKMGILKIKEFLLNNLNYDTFSTLIVQRILFYCFLFYIKLQRVEILSL